MIVSEIDCVAILFSFNTFSFFLLFLAWCHLIFTPQQTIQTEDSSTSPIHFQDEEDHSDQLQQQSNLDGSSSLDTAASYISPRHSNEDGQGSPVTVLNVDLQQQNERYATAETATEPVETAATACQTEAPTPSPSPPRSPSTIAPFSPPPLPEKIDMETQVIECVCTCVCGHE